MLLPSLIITIGFVVLPIINSLIRSFKDPNSGAFSLINYTSIFNDPIMVANIFYTIKIALIIVLLSILVSYPFAIYVRFNSSKISKKLYNLILIPRFIPGMVAVYSIIQFINDSGLINRIGQIFGYNWQLGYMYNQKGIIYTGLWFNIPFATLIIAATLSSINKSSLESARDIGASKLSIFINIILPLSYKDVLVAATFIFISNVGAFTTPYLLGENNPRMLGVVLNDIFSVYRRYESAAALSVVMFLICVLAAFVYVIVNLKEKPWEKK